VDELPFGIGNVSRVSHPQFLGEPPKRSQKLMVPGTNQEFSNTL
jgi:hypothetical protein